METSWRPHITGQIHARADILFKKIGKIRGPGGCTCSEMIVNFVIHAMGLSMPTPKQAAFVQFYLVDLNATQAAIKAGYSPKSAHVTGSKLLRNPKVATAIEDGKALTVRQTGITKEWLVEKLRGTFEDAHKAGHGQIVVRAGELLARMHGYIDDKPQSAQQQVALIIQR